MWRNRKEQLYIMVKKTSRLPLVNGCNLQKEPCVRSEDAVNQEESSLIRHSLLKGYV